MFKEKTAIILGAGSSCHLDYPLGSVLIDKVKNSEMTSVAGEYAWKTPPQELSDRLNEMQPLSIDMFLSYHSAFEEVGKEIIAYELLQVETKDINIESNWYRFLVDSLISGCQKPEDLLINNDNLMIITFNYDISLEYYLYTRLKKISFFKDVFDSFIKNIKIIHTYGQLGCFNWHEDFLKNNYDKIDIYKRDISGYGEDSAYYKEISKNIQIIGIRKWDTTSIPKHIEIIRKHLNEVKKVFILGFGFYEENMELINLNKSFFQKKDRMYYYTNLNNQQKIERKLLNRNVNYNKNGNFIKSTKKVYEALLEDFEFIE